MIYINARAIMYQANVSALEVLPPQDNHCDSSCIAHIATTTTKKNFTITTKEAYLYYPHSTKYNGSV